MMNHYVTKEEVEKEIRSTKRIEKVLSVTIYPVLLFAMALLSPILVAFGLLEMPDN